MAAQIMGDETAWIRANWDPTLTVAQWWSLLADVGLSNPTLPEPWGRGWSREEAGVLARAMTDHGALGPPSGIGMMLAAPTILAHGSPDLIDRYVRKILDGRHGWCQLFSEPGAGSDLAGLQTKAERDGDEWVIDGQKVWTSGGQWADFGILVARSDASLPKHRGLTYFAFPMLQPGVEVRPLREMTGHALFNEVFLTAARVAHPDVIGEVNSGWKVANTTLMFERAGIGGGGASAFSAATPGTVAGHLDQPAGNFTQGDAGFAIPSVGHVRLRQLTALARERGLSDDPVIRQRLAQMHTLIEISSWHVERMRTGAASTGGEGNIAKLRNSQMVALARELGCAILGMHATVTGKDAMSEGEIQELTLFSPAPSIYGGTDQVQRNILGERALGLPREPGPARETPFNQIPHNV